MSERRAACADPGWRRPPPSALATGKAPAARDVTGVPSYRDASHSLPQRSNIG